MQIPNRVPEWEYQPGSWASMDENCETSKQWTDPMKIDSRRYQYRVENISKEFHENYFQYSVYVTCLFIDCVIIFQGIYKFVV